jgi:hypothetical protein
MPAARTTVTSEKGAFGFLVLPANTRPWWNWCRQGVRPDCGLDGSRDHANFILGALGRAGVGAGGARVPKHEVNFTFRRTLRPAADRSYMGLMQPSPESENGGFAPNGGGSRRTTRSSPTMPTSRTRSSHLSTEINELDIAEFA